MSDPRRYDMEAVIAMEKDRDMWRRRAKVAEKSENDAAFEFRDMRNERDRLRGTMERIRERCEREVDLPDRKVIGKWADDCLRSVTASQSTSGAETGVYFAGDTHIEDAAAKTKPFTCGTCFGVGRSPTPCPDCGRERATQKCGGARMFATDGYGNPSAVAGFVMTCPGCPDCEPSLLCKYCGNRGAEPFCRKCLRKPVTEAGTPPKEQP